MSLEYTFYLRDKSNSITKTLSDDDLLTKTKFTSNIKMELARTQNITIQSNISPDSFEKFINYATNQSQEGFNGNNLKDFILLYYELLYDKNKDGHDQFKSELIKILERNNEEFDKLLDILIDKKDDDKFDKKPIESQIAYNLDDLIGSFPEKMKQIAITSLINIFRNPERQLKNHNSAYKFIIDTINTSNNCQFCCLIQYLDGKYMTKELLNDALANKSKHLGFIPEISDDFLTSLQEKISNCEKKYTELLPLKDSSENNENLTDGQKLQIDQILREFGKKQMEIFDLHLKSQINELALKQSNFIDSLNELSTKQEQNACYIAQIKKNISEINQTVFDLLSTKHSASNSQNSNSPSNQSTNANVDIDSIIQTALAPHERATTYIKNEINSIKNTKKNEIDPAIAKLTTDINDINTSLKKLSKSHRSISKDINELQEAKDSLTTSVKLINQQLSSSSTKIQNSPSNKRQSSIGEENENDSQQPLKPPEKTQQPEKPQQPPKPPEKTQQPEKLQQPPKPPEKPQQPLKQLDYSQQPPKPPSASQRLNMFKNYGGQTASLNSPSANLGNRPKSQSTSPLNVIHSLDIINRQRSELSGIVKQGFKFHKEVIIYISNKFSQIKYTTFSKTLESIRSNENPLLKLGLAVYDIGYKINNSEIFDYLEIDYDDTDEKLTREMFISDDTKEPRIENVCIPFLKKIPKEFFKNYKKLKVISFAHNIKSDSQQKNDQQQGVLEVIGDSAFQGCDELVHIDLPPSVRIIGDHAFSNCAKLTSVNIRSSGKLTIESFAFFYCPELKELKIPMQTEIKEKAFQGCKNFQKLLVPKNYKLRDGKYWSYISLEDSQISEY